MENATAVDFDILLLMILDYLEDNNEDDIADATKFILSQSAPNLKNVIFKANYLNGGIEEEILTELLASPQVRSLSLLAIEASCAEAMLRKAVEISMPRLCEVAIAFHEETTKAQAEAIFSILSTFSNLELKIFLGNFSEALGGPFAQFLRESRSVKIMSLSWREYRQDEDLFTRVSIPESVITCICNGIGLSTSLWALYIPHPPFDAEADVAAALLTTAICKCSSITKVGMVGIQDFCARIDRALVRTPTVENFDLCFRVEASENKRRALLTLNRNIKWKALLPEDVPLSYWPYILEKANSWKKETSHSPYDAVYFLLKEKNDVLIRRETVRQASTRKRKHNQIE